MSLGCFWRVHNYSRSSNNWREGYLLQTWARKITCWCFNWMLWWWLEHSVETLFSEFKLVTENLFICVEANWEANWEGTKMSNNDFWRVNNANMISVLSCGAHTIDNTMWSVGGFVSRVVLLWYQCHILMKMMREIFFWLFSSKLSTETVLKHPHWMLSKWLTVVRVQTRFGTLACELMPDYSTCTSMTVKNSEAV